MTKKLQPFNLMNVFFRISTTRTGQHLASRLTPCRLKSSIYRVRSTLYPPVPITLYDLGELLRGGEHTRITTTEDGFDNIFSEMVRGNGFTSLIFISRRMRRCMRRVRTIFCDGTFASRPNEPRSGQVLQLSAVVRNNVGIYHLNQ